MKFSGPEIGRIKDALVESFDVDDLEELTLRYLDLQLKQIVSPGSLNKMALQLVMYTNNRHITCDLIHAAFAERPKVPEWRELDRLCNAGPVVAAQVKGAALDGAPARGDGLPQSLGRPSVAVLEGLVKPRLRIMDMERWRRRETEVAAQVCRVDVAGAPKGTGFLVGPDLVLTNQHVVASAGSTGVRCVFDYKRLSDGTVYQGRPVDAAADWLVASSPPSEAERAERPDDALPTPDQLDFALVRLADPIGSAPVATAGAGARGWVSLPSLQPPLPPGGPMLIVQHPQSEPISMSLDTDAIEGLNGNGTRVRYATNTEPGSSGSPCFDFDWSLIALHHMGDPNWRNPSYNQGVPIGLIALRIAHLLPKGPGDA